MRAGIERLNQLMIKVARDRQANTELADQNFLQYQKFLHGPRREAAVWMCFKQFQILKLYKTV